MTASDQVLTVAQMRAAEEALISRGESVASLMERAGTGAADWVLRVAAGRPVTVLCGPGNNGGDGYVIARVLHERGVPVSVVTPVEPATPAARDSRTRYAGPIGQSGPGAVLVDCLFGSGLARPLTDEHVRLLHDLAASHPARIAVDLPSGVDADTGRPLNERLPRFHLTLALGAWKPAHGLMPALGAMGECRLVPIGIAAVPQAGRMVPRPHLSAPGRDAHKYTRGLVLVVEGTMAGAALLACEGAMRCGAGAVRLTTERLHPALPPDVVLKSEPLAELLDDKRTGAVLAGPGLGRDDKAAARLRQVLASGLASVIDADALALVRPADLAGVAAPLIFTPHAGEMATLAKSFALEARDKVSQALELARKANAVIISKGPDTVIAAPDGQAGYLPTPTSWLSVGGSGDVLAGIVASRLAGTGDPFRAACEGAWLHAEAGRLAGPAFLASDIARHLPAAVAACL